MPDPDQTAAFPGPADAWHIPEVQPAAPTTWTPGTDTTQPPAAPTTPSAAATPTGTHLDTKNWNITNGDPKAATGGYFIGGIGEQGAKWRTGDGGFSGSMHADGGTADLKAGADNLHLNVDAKKSAGDLTLTDKDKNQLLDVYGSQDAIGVKNTYDTADGKLTPAIEHDLKNGGSEVAKVDYAKDKTTGSASATLNDKGGFAAAINGKVTDDATHSDAANAGFTAKDGKETLSLGTTNVDGDTTTTRALNANAGATNSVGDSVSVANKTDTTTMSQSFGTSGNSLTMQEDHKFADGATLGGGFTMGTDAKGNVADSAKIAGSMPGLGGTFTGNAAVSDNAGKVAVDGGVGYSNATDKVSITGHDGGAHDMNLNAAYNHTGTNGTTAGATLGVADTITGTSIKAGENYGSKAFAESANVTGTTGGGTPDAFKAGGSTSVRLADNIYAGMYGDVSTGGGKPTGWDAGGSVTYMPSKNIGITAAGGYGSNGAEGRLQADLYQKNIDGAATLEDQKKKSSISLFIDASTGPGAGLGNQLGTGNINENLGQMGGGGPMIKAGIGFNF